MKIMKHLKTAAAAASLAVLSAPAMAADNEIVNAVTTELGGLKASVVAIGVIAIGISIAFATIRVGKRGSNSVG
ncbi:major capsid protein [Neisseria cinerea]|uniref:major capsid protein n=1 Tax=Neisseria cinerea TaxID=483 RepID=UPI002B1DA456|nr:major capsid protein [Neisseria cinerea]